MPERISYAQNAEDVRVWRALRHLSEQGGALTYIDVGANNPWDLSITASLYLDGWNGLLIEADPFLAEELRGARPRDQVINAAASNTSTPLTFYRVPGTGLGTVDEDEAQNARARGFEVEKITVAAIPLSQMWDEYLGEQAQVHFLSIDVEGAEASVIGGWDRSRHRPWIACVEAVEPGTRHPTHSAWESALLADGYTFVAFDGVNRWYVASENADTPAADGYTLAELVSTPINAFDVGVDGWINNQERFVKDRAVRSMGRAAWQRELSSSSRETTVPIAEYERQITELRDEVISLRGSRAYRLSREMIKPVSRLKFELQRLRNHAPGPVSRALTRRRVLRHVTANMHHLIHPAYLGSSEPVAPTWSTDLTIPAPSIPKDDLDGPARDLTWAQEWLTIGPKDTDALLQERMDNHGDEVGRTQAALRTRLALARVGMQDQPTKTQGDRMLIDVRSLQSRAFGGRGIGRFARAGLEGAVQGIDPSCVDLLVDPDLDPLPEYWRQTYRAVECISEQQAAEYAVLVQLSPMTHTPEPLIPVLKSSAHSIAIVFDFIPAHYRSVYLSTIPQHCEYAAQLDALRRYDEFVCISQVTQQELCDFLGDETRPTSVAWPRDINPESPVRKHIQRNSDGPIVLMTGDEPRKNTFTGLAGIAAATIDEDFRDVQVIGMAGLDDRVHHWSIAAMMRPGEATTLERISDEELRTTLASASLVVVPSFDEGLSLPVLEAIAAGTPVVASDIPAHRELLGSGTFLADPASPTSLSKAIAQHRGSTKTWRKQAARLTGHQHAGLEELIGDRVHQHLKSSEASTNTNATRFEDEVRPDRLKVALVTPWSPQATGVGDFSTTIGIELARHVELTVITTADADVAESLLAIEDAPRIKVRPLDHYLNAPQELAQFDRVIAVVGNSHFHLPILELTHLWPCVVVAHDTRMVEFYLARDGRGHAEHLMLRTADPSAAATISPPLDEQIADMRLLQNAGMWEVAQRAHPLILHSPSAAPEIQQQTGVRPQLLPFANQRIPYQDPTPQARKLARERLEFDENCLHVGTFGYVDMRTKLTDVVLEAAGWMTRWGHRIHLHVVGQASEADTQALRERAEQWGLHGLTITGFTSDEQFRDYLLAVDLGVQLRISPLLGVSGPLSDLSAFGTRAVASEGLCADVDAPAFVTPLPQAISPTLLAAAIEDAVREPRNEMAINDQRIRYLETKTPEVYVQGLLAILRKEST